jgi:hypothetical protein
MKWMMPMITIKEIPTRMRNTYSSPHIPGTATFLNKCGDIIKLSSHFISGDGGLEPNNILLIASL